jgi:hypothetical protein
MLAAPVERSSTVSLGTAKIVVANEMVALRATGAASNSPTERDVAGAAGAVGGAVGGAD